MKTDININVQKRQIITNELSKILANEYVLYTKTRNTHLNLEGMAFTDKHKFFETQLVQLNYIIDKVAERIRFLGHFVNASLGAFLRLTQLTEMRIDNNDSRSYITELLQDHQSIIVNLIKNNKSLTTNTSILARAISLPCSCKNMKKCLGS